MSEIVSQNPETENKKLLELLLSVSGNYLSEETMDDLVDVGDFRDTLGAAYGFLIESGMEIEKVDKLLSENGILE